MYQKPTLARFGSFRDLTQAGCVSATDGRTFFGSEAGNTVPRVTNGTTDYCFNGGSR